MQTPLDTQPIQSVTMNGGSGRWIVHKGVMVALIHLGLYFVEQGAVVHVVARESLFVKMNALEVSYANQMNLPFPKGELK